MLEGIIFPSNVKNKKIEKKLKLKFFKKSNLKNLKRKCKALSYNASYNLALILKM